MVLSEAALLVVGAVLNSMQYLSPGVTEFSPAGTSYCLFSLGCIIESFMSLLCTHLR